MTVSSSQICNLPAFRLYIKLQLNINIVFVFSPPDANRHTINCYAKENSDEKPRNLKRLEYDHQLLSKKGEGAQFTVSIPLPLIFIF